MNRRRLYRCSHDRVLAGVAGGVAEYFDVDPSLVRILWVLSIFAGGLTILLYIAMALVVPLEPDTFPAPGPWQPGSEGWGAPAASGSASSAAAGEAGAAAEVGGAGAAGATDAGAGAENVSGQPVGQSVGGAATSAGWQPAYGYHHRERRPSRFGAQFFGAVLILFGAIALADQFLPAWADHGRFLWPAFILACGVLLVVTSITRRTHEL
jgi:phage shock protein C